jgi:hypothetical protein
MNTNMKLRGLLQKCSFFSPIRLAVFCPAAPARVKLHSKFVWERFATAIKIDRIPLFDVRCWTFDIRFFKVSFIDRTDRCAVSGWHLTPIFLSYAAIFLGGAPAGA